MTDQYFAALEKEKAKLDATGENYSYVTSIENEITGCAGGVVTQVPNQLAAKAVLAGTARVSTQEEIDAHLHRGPVGEDAPAVTV